MQQRTRYQRSRLGLLSFCFLIISGCAHCMVQAPPTEMPDASNATRSGTTVRTPLPPPTLGEPVAPPHDYESYELDTVLPNSSTTFDPFTYGRQGSPYGPGQMFAPGARGGRCSLMRMPMSAQFADPGDKQAVIIIVGNGVQCVPDIDHDKPGAALSFQLVGPPFVNPPWQILSDTGSLITITNGNVTIRFGYSIGSDFTTISSVEYL